MNGNRSRGAAYALALAFGLAALLTKANVAVCAPSEKWRGVPVLMYHRVDAAVPRDAVGRDLTVEPAAFEAQLRYLRAHHIATLTAAELAGALARGRRPERAIVLTFDDGYDDAASTALPLLVRYGARGTFYVSSGFVGTPRHLTWRAMRAMRAAGMEIACHGTEHLDLSTLDRSGQFREAGGCMRRFARYLGGPPPVTYAYPAGKYDAVTLAVMRSLHIRAAFTEMPGTVTSLAQPFALPRLRVRHDDGIARFAALTTP
jgi:peptidoglycan/xylan/chitin deacetylase (PgdA/CDA1 family)